MERRTSPGGTRRHGARRFLAATVAGLTATTVLTVAPASAPPAVPTAPSTVTSVADATVAAAQVLTWTGDNSVTDYKTFPATAEAGPATIVFENSVATGSTFGMSHTLTFDTSTPGYNHDVNLNILASPFDANGGRHEAEVTLTPGTYRYFCAIPGHGEMWGELVVTDGGGGDDTTAPSVTAQVTGEQDGDGAYVGGATVTLAATDDGSGVAGVEYDLDGAGWTAYDAPFVVDAVGAHTLQFRATDAAGNTSEAQTATFTVVEGSGEEDTTAPTVEPMLMGEQDENGAYVGTAAFMLHAADEGSGVASVEYQLDGGAWLPYTTTVAFTELGEHTVSYRATDVAGNVSEVGSVTFTVVAGGEEDTTAPTVTAEVTGEQDDNGAFVGSATATLTATDDASGVESVEYDLDGAGWAPYTEPVVVDEPGEHTLLYRATDVAGNVSEESVTEFVVVAEAEEDTTAPTVAHEVSGTQDESGAYVGSASVLVTATDDGSGVASVEYDLDGAGWTAYTGAVVVDEPGQHTLAYRATDEAGNVSEAASVTFAVVEGDGSDTVAPSVAHRVMGGEKNEAGEYLGNVFVRLNATDADSGVASVEYQLDGGEWTPYAKQVSVRTPGAHTITYRATDVAGNVSAPQSVTFVIAGGEEPGDTEGPVVTAGVSGSRTRDGDYVASARVTLTAVDEESGVDRIEFQADGGAWQRYATTVAFAADGQHVVRYRAVDGAGNVSATGEVTFTVLRLARDRCVGSDVRPTVVIDGHDSTVENYDDGTGCTVNDHVAETDEYPTHREFVDHVSLVTEDLVLDGVLDDAERELIIAAAMLSDIGR